MGTNRYKHYSDGVRIALSEKKYLIALIEASTNIESLLFEKLMFEKKINPGLMENWTLGILIKRAFTNNLIDKEYKDLLEIFKEIRNIIIHERYNYFRLENDPDKLKTFENLLLTACDFIDENWIKYEIDEEINKRADEHLNKIIERFNKIFDRIIKPQNL